MRSSVVAVCALVVCAIVSGPIYAQRWEKRESCGCNCEMIPISPAVMAAIMKSEGYTITGSEDRGSMGGHSLYVQDGLKHFAIATSTSLQVRIYFKGLMREKDRLPFVNDWNRRKKFTKAYVDDDGDFVLEGEIELVGGRVTREQFLELLRTFAVSRGIFVVELNQETSKSLKKKQKTSKEELAM